ncbi:DNA gyrase C-terminal beta-propeller domain-containing protein [Glutamicibacter halophytocola]|uniref:DNA gyrase C-terminal beta-propeller domain-containing protein n=1 Tax=Glutamicibacter halophytocola TaxID=1933880 RepID=UPI003D28C802
MPAAVAGEDDELVFLTRGAQLLRFPASAVRPQGRTGRGMAGIKLSADDHVIFFGVVPPSAQNAVVATIAAGSQTLPGTSGQSVKLTEFAEFPAKGRATAGVRAHRFIKGEDHLQLAFAGQGPARASSSAGVVRALPTEFGKRDGSGAPLAQTVNILGGSLSAAESSAAQAPDSPADAPVGNAVQDEHPKAAPAFNPGEDTLPFDDGGVIL